MQTAQGKSSWEHSQPSIFVMSQIVSRDMCRRTEEVQSQCIEGRKWGDAVFYGSGCWHQRRLTDMEWLLWSPSLVVGEAVNMIPTSL
jgi:hypothetical protein